MKLEQHTRPKGPLVRRTGLPPAVQAGRVPACVAALLAAGCTGPEIEGPSLRTAQGAVEYPYEMWNRGVEGTTTVRVLVNEAGGVDSATVAVSSGVPTLDSAAVTGALRMEFEPARRDGAPVRVWTRIPIHFEREEAVAADSQTAGPNLGAVSGSGDRTAGEGRQ